MEQLKVRLNASANIWEKYFGIELCFFVHVQLYLTRHFNVITG